ncbi:TonB-dependent receptor [Colwellia sp. RE-S-Sl-9]
MLNFKPSKVALAILSTGLVALSSPTYAAETEKAVEKEVEVIQVTGIRGSLIKSQAIKMSSSSIVEAISAEDIGKLPSTSIAESLARLPGVTGERRNGRVSGLSIRGFNENYIGTTLNGRELLGMGENRGVEFDLYPAEIITNLIVAKTPVAGMITQGIGGSIDLQTVSPLVTEESMAINAVFEKNSMDSANPDYDNKGHKLAFNMVEKFADDTLGVALVISSIESPAQEEQFRSWGYANVNTDSARRATDTVDVPAGTVVLGGHDSYVRSGLLKRDSIAAVIEWAPSNDLKFQFDALYIDFQEEDNRRGIEEGMAEWGTGDYNITGVENGVVTSGYTDGFHSIVRNDVNNTDAKLTTFGLNLEYQISDNWIGIADFSTGDVERSITNMESYSGVGRAGIDGRPLAARSWEMTSKGVMFSDHPSISGVDLTDPSVIQLAGPQAWGGGLAPIADRFVDDNLNFNHAQDGFINKPITDEKLNSLRLEVQGVLDYEYVKGISAGVNFSDREKTRSNTGYYLTAPNWPASAPIDNPLGVANLDFIGINGILAYNAISLFENGFYTAHDASELQTDRLGTSWTVKEEIITAFVKLDIEGEIGDVYVTGNFGLQVIDVDQQSAGYDVYIGQDTTVVSSEVIDGDTYTDVLPTLNLSFEIAEDVFIRTAASKVMSRARLDDMRSNNQVSFNFNNSFVLSNQIDRSPWSGSSGNAKLKPLEANQFDLSFEYYFADDGFFATSFYYKDLTNWHRNGIVATDFSEFYVPGYHQSNGEHDLDNDGIADGPLPPVQFTGATTFREDGLTGFVRGYEIQASVPLRLIDDMLEGFGFTGSATFIDGEFEDGTDVPGLSKESYSFTGYYEMNGFEARITGTKRDRFATETRGLSLALTQIDDEGAELWDAQVGYDFGKGGFEQLEGLSLFFSGQNITGEDTVQLDANGNINQYQSFGATYQLGMHYKF